MASGQTEGDGILKHCSGLVVGSRRSAASSTTLAAISTPLVMRLIWGKRPSVRHTRTTAVIRTSAAICPNSTPTLNARILGTSSGSLRERHLLQPGGRPKPWMSPNTNTITSRLGGDAEPAAKPSRFSTAL